MPKQSKSSQKQMLQRSLKLLTNLVSNLSEEDIAALLSGSAQLSVIPSVSRNQNSQTTHETDLVGRLSNASKFLDQLKSAKSTEEAHQMLVKASFTKAELEIMARIIDIPVIKRDDIMRMEEKIVEALVGSRLNSQAVRGI